MIKLVKKRKLAVLLLLPLVLACFLSVGYSQLTDNTIISMSGKDWTLKVDGTLQSSLDSKNTPYMTSKSTTEKELFLELASLEDAKSGVVQFKIDLQGLTAYKQLPLDVELDVKEYDFVNSTHAINGSQVVVYRPENIVNSFALFDSKGMKQAHISASKLVDADGAVVWCDSNLESGLLSVVLPLEWLETAKFPVVLDPTFGYTTEGGSWVEIYNSQVAGSKFNVSEAGTISKITMYAKVASTTRNIREAIYSDNAGQINALLANGTENSVTSTPAWVDSNVTYAFSAGIYWLTFICSGTVSIAYDSGDTDQGVYDSGVTYSTFPDPVTATYPTYYSTNKYSIYATYEAGGEPTPTPTPSPSPSPSPVPSVTPVVNGDLTDTEWFVAAMILVLVVVNIVLLAFPFALVRFVFGALSFSLSAIAFVFDQVPLAPYLQIMGLVVSVLCMFLATRARE